MNQLISILMPVYNAQSFLEECLNSILKQSIEHWELIAIDDFSDDNSLSILRAFAQKDSRIHVFSNDQKGIISALQKAYKFCNGTLVTRMDADDIMPRIKLEQLSNTLEQNPKSCITAKVEYFSNGILMEGYKKYADWLNELIKNQNHYSQIYKECIIPSPCWMMSKETFEKIGGFSSDIYPEDYDLCFRLYQHRVPVVGVDEILHLWRDHGDRASRNDPNYENNSFLDIKIHYFEKLDYNKSKGLILWGAGGSGKEIAKKLVAKKLAFQWLTDNPNKIGHNIYGITLSSTELLQDLNDSQIFIAVKQRGFKEENEFLIQELECRNDVFSFY